MDVGIPPKITGHWFLFFDWNKVKCLFLRYTHTPLIKIANRLMWYTCRLIPHWKRNHVLQLKMKLVSEVVFLAMHLSGTLFQICSLTQRNSSSVWSNLSLNLHESYFVIEESWGKTYRWKLSQMATIVKVFYYMYVSLNYSRTVITHCFRVMYRFKRNIGT